jgi:hypothetical protein
MAWAAYEGIRNNHNKLVPDHLSVMQFHVNFIGKKISGSFTEKFTNPASQLSWTTGKVTFSAKKH